MAGLFQTCFISKTLTPAVTNLKYPTECIQCSSSWIEHKSHSTCNKTEGVTEVWIEWTLNVNSIKTKATERQSCVEIWLFHLDYKNCLLMRKSYEPEGKSLKLSVLQAMSSEVCAKNAIVWLQCLLLSIRDIWKYLDRKLFHLWAISLLFGNHTA